MWQTLLLISSGAALGAISRWGLYQWLNPIFATFSFGTLIANYLGCFLIGICTALFWQTPHISAEWKLFLVTGFLGSLTTFSAFSNDVVENLLSDKLPIALSLISLHVFGSLAFTFLGIWLMKSIFG
ncbi:chromosome condensation protein CrcB [Pasteurellaceae bacterium Pebbles2]|nr:chromosome condensation protein CrcB [Pasteurellaceae bacterium Pebbles2]